MCTTFNLNICENDTYIQSYTKIKTLNLTLGLSLSPLMPKIETLRLMPKIILCDPLFVCPNVSLPRV